MAQYSHREWLSQEEHEELVGIILRKCADAKNSTGINADEFVGELVNLVLDYSHRSEKQRRREKQMQGIARARENGTQFGRPKAPVPDDFSELVTRWENKEITFQQILEMSGLSMSTFYRRVRKLRETENR